MVSVSILLLLLACHARANISSPSQKITLTLGGIFDIRTRAKDDNSANMIPAVEMALKHVNDDPQILKNYRLELEIKDVKCRDSYAIRSLIEFIREKKQKIMIIGPGCSESAEPFAKAAHFYNLVQISMATANPDLSCKRNFPTFVRTIPPEHYQNMGRVKMLSVFGWKNVAVVQERLDTLDGLSSDLISKLKKVNVTVISHEIFKGDATNALENIMKKDGRIMFGMFKESTARKVMCQAYKLGMWGPRYVWIIMSGGYHDKWWTTNDTSCTPMQVCKGLGHYFGTKALMRGAAEGVTVAGKTVKALWYEYYTAVASGPYSEPSPYAAFAYDAVWTAALGLNNSLPLMDTKNGTRGMTLSNFTYNNTAMRKLFMSVIKKTSFSGMSGLVTFDRKYERLGTLIIEQHQGTKTPVCSAKKISVSIYISPYLMYLMSSLCVAGITMAIIILLFNFKNRGVRYIKMSSPRLNNIIILGCVLIYLSGIMAGIDGNFVSERIQGNICQLQAWTVTTGFTLAFGALFSKTWRVHVIFLNKTEKIVIKDGQLLGIVIGFLLVDVIVLTLWQLLDPMRTTYVNLPHQILADGDIVLLPFTTQCTSRYLSIWSGVLYAYKGFLLIFGTYLAWETRKVTIAALNDSKSIGISVYNVVIPCVLVIPVLHVIKDNVDAVYGMTSLLCLLCTTVTLCLIFGPKVLYMWSIKKKNPIDVSVFNTLGGGSKGITTLSRQDSPTNRVGVSSVNISAREIPSREGTYIVCEALS